MNEQEAWAPVFAFLIEQGYALPETVQIEVAGHTLTVDVPEDMVSPSAG